MGTPVEAAVVAIVVTFVCASVLQIFAPIVFSLAVYVFSGSSGILSRILNALPFRKLGDWSYSIYMIHPIVVAVMMQFGLFYTEYAVCIYLLVTIVISAMTYTFLESPARNFFNLLATKRRNLVFL